MSAPLLPVLPFIAATLWPPSALTSAQAERVERGDVLFDARVSEGAVDSKLGLAFATDAETVWAATRDFCSDPAPKNQKERRFFEPARIEPILSEDFRPERLEGVPARRCQDVAGHDSLYVYVVTSTPAVLPDIWNLVHMRRRALHDGSFTIETEQVAGTMKEVRTRVHVLPISPQKTAFVETSHFVLGAALPDFLLKKLVQGDQETRVALRVKNLRRRVLRRQQLRSPPVAPQSSLQNSQPTSSSATGAHGR